jgi:hypothetical protein
MLDRDDFRLATAASLTIINADPGRLTGAV